MRDIDTVDGEFRLLARDCRHSTLVDNGQPITSARTQCVRVCDKRRGC
jgi:hypothetical protein